MATNPLMGAMICALHRDRRQKLPESLSELVEALCHTLIDRGELESSLQCTDAPNHEIGCVARTIPACSSSTSPFPAASSPANLSLPPAFPTIPHRNS